jgi:HSP20 family protein
MADEEKKKEVNVTLDLGFGGLFKGLGDLVDLVAKTAAQGEETSAEQGEGAQTKQGEIRFKSAGREGRAVYGFSIRSGLGGLPKVERFGNVRTTAEGPVVAEVREPLVDLFDEQAEIIVVAELPGVAEEEIHINIQDDILSLETTGERKYAKEILLPCAVNADTLQKSYRNGILELHLRKTGHDQPDQAL